MLSNLTSYPLTQPAWQYLTETAQIRPPFRYFVRWDELVRVARALDCQLTFEETEALVGEDSLMLCRCPKHNKDHAFMGVQHLVLLSHNRANKDPNPINGVPESLWPFIARYPDGSAVIAGQVSVIRNGNDWELVYYCGSRYYINGQGEVFNNRSHLGQFILRSRGGNRPERTFSWENACKTLDIRRRKSVGC